MTKQTGQKVPASGARSSRTETTVDKTIGDAIARARQYEDAGDVLAAVQLLEELWVQDTECVPVITELLQLQIERGNWHRCLEILEELPEKDACDNAELCLSRMQVYLQADTGFPFLALRALRDFQTHFPQHPGAQAERGRLAKLERICKDVEAEIREQNPLPLRGEAATRFLEQHDAMRARVSTRNWDDVLLIAEQMAVAVPAWPPMQNNLSIALGMIRRHGDALAEVERVLAASPQNAFARRQQITQLFLLRRPDDAEKAAAQALRDDERESAGTPGARLTARVLLAQTLALIGDDAGILTLRARAAAAGREDGPAVARAELLWLAGNAELRHGRPDAARTLFRQAQTSLNSAQAEAGSEDAERVRARVVASLTDLSRPLGTRHGPAYLDLSLFNERDVLVDITVGRPLAVQKERTYTFLEGRPGMQVVLSALLDRGDDAARTLAVSLIQMTELPALLPALRDFVLGPHGPDALRLELLGLLREKGTLPDPHVRMWVQGVQTDLLSLSFEVTDEPTHTHPPAVQALAERAIDATHDGRLDTAEEALLQARALAPDAPDLLKNLVTVYELTDRQPEADALFATLRARFPTYSFGLLHEADHHVRRGQPEQALALIAPLLRRPRLHVKELMALCWVQVRAMLALGKPTVARLWVELLAAHAPEESVLKDLREQIDLAVGLEQVTKQKPGRATKSRPRESDAAHR